MIEAIIGTWSLVDYLLVRADGVVRKPWGDDVAGLLIYTAEGFMSANLMPAVRKKAAHPDLLAALSAKSQRSSRYIGYAGTFSVEGDTITHHVEVSLFPSWIGLPQVRYYEISAESLILRTPPIPRLAGC
jgi:hypothetical protein